MSEPIVIRCYDDLIDAMRARVAEIGITMEMLDELTGLQSGYCAKLLGPARIKTLGVLSFNLLMEAMALQFEPQTDMAKARELEARWEGRERPAAIQPAKASKKALQRFRPIILQEHFKAIAHLGAKARSAGMTPRQRKGMARKAAIARAKKLSPERRAQIASEAGKVSSAKLSKRELTIRARRAAQARWGKP